MKKKLFVSILFLVITLILSFSYTFAANETENNPMEGIRNFVGGAENAMEDAASGIANGVRNITGTAENGMESTTNNENNSNNSGTNNNGANNRDMQNNTTGGMMTDNNNGGDYTAARTSGEGLFGGTGNTLMWVVVILAAIAIIALIWAYIRSTNASNNHNDDENKY